LLHVPCRNFASLFVVRFFLGVTEACIVPAFLLILSMYFTYDEQAVLMPIMWAIGNSSPITSGLLSYGVLWMDTGSFAPWRWFMGEWSDVERERGNLRLTSSSRSHHRQPDRVVRYRCLAMATRQPSDRTIPHCRGARASYSQDQEQSLRYRAEVLQEGTVHRSVEGSENLDVLPPRLESRDGQRHYQPVFTDHQIFRLLDSRDNSPWLCQRSDSLLLAWCCGVDSGEDDELPRLAVCCIISVPDRRHHPLARTS
jgi:hypothetical protein